jgi:hypothetical protein
MTRMRYVQPGSGDDFKYLEWVECVIGGVVRSTDPHRWFVVKVDNWFGKRWLGFSGKAMGTVGVHKEKLTLPPFTPSRVVSQYRFWRRATNPGRHPGLHVYQRSGENLHRYVEVVVQDSSVFWYSGQSDHNGRASFMAYVSTPDGHWPWYAGLNREPGWRVVESVGIGLPELESFARAKD